MNDRCHEFGLHAHQETYRGVRERALTRFLKRRDVRQCFTHASAPGEHEGGDEQVVRERKCGLPVRRAGE